jgi:hypothetical protein
MAEGLVGGSPPKTIAKQLSDKLQQGWALLGIHCPICKNPCLRDKEQVASLFGAFFRESRAVFPHRHVCVCECYMFSCRRLSSAFRAVSQSSQKKQPRCLVNTQTHRPLPLLPRVPGKTTLMSRKKVFSYCVLLHTSWMWMRCWSVNSYPVCCVSMEILFSEADYEWHPPTPEEQARIDARVCVSVCVCVCD